MFSLHQPAEANVKLETSVNLWLNTVLTLSPFDDSTDWGSTIRPGDVGYMEGVEPNLRFIKLGSIPWEDEPNLKVRHSSESVRYPKEKESLTDTEGGITRFASPHSCRCRLLTTLDQMDV